MMLVKPYIASAHFFARHIPPACRSTVREWFDRLLAFGVWDTQVLVNIVTHIARHRAIVCKTGDEVIVAQVLDNFPENARDYARLLLDEFLDFPEDAEEFTRDFVDDLDLADEAQGCEYEEIEFEPDE